MSFSFNFEKGLEKEVVSLEPTNDIELAIRKTEYHESKRLLEEHLREGGQINAEVYRVPKEAKDSGEYGQQKNNGSSFYDPREAEFIPVKF